MYRLTARCVRREQEVVRVRVDVTEHMRLVHGFEELAQRVDIFLGLCVILKHGYTARDIVLVELRIFEDVILVIDLQPQPVQCLEHLQTALDILTLRIVAGTRVLPVSRDLHTRVGIDIYQLVGDAPAREETVYLCLLMSADDAVRALARYADYVFAPARALKYEGNVGQPLLERVDVADGIQSYIFLDDLRRLGKCIQELIRAHVLIDKTALRTRGLARESRGGIDTACGGVA